MTEPSCMSLDVSPPHRCVFVCLSPSFFWRWSCVFPACRSGSTNLSRKQPQEQVGISWRLITLYITPRKFTTWHFHAFLLFSYTKLLQIIKTKQPKKKRRWVVITIVSWGKTCIFSDVLRCSAWIFWDISCCFALGLSLNCWNESSHRLLLSGRKWSLDR